MIANRNNNDIPTQSDIFIGTNILLWQLVTCNVK